MITEPKMRNETRFGRVIVTMEKGLIAVALLKQGEVNGYMRVLTTISLSESGNEFMSRECVAQFLDTNWKVLDSDRDEVKGTRLETP